MNQKVYHLRTNVKNNKPESSQIEIGEIALNYASDSETIMFKNDADEIVEFKDSKYYEKLIDENELVTANALNNLNDRVLVIEDVIDNTIINEIENLYEEISKKQDSSDELNEIIENVSKKIETIKNEISDLDYIRENISIFKEDIVDIQEELVDIYQEISDTNKAIEDNEKVISAAIVDLNERVTLVDDNAASISESLTELNQRVENGEIGDPFFKSFATLSEYETAVANGEVVYPCVAFIEESGTIKFMANVVYNAIVTLSEDYIAIFGDIIKGILGFYPLCFANYFDSVIVDGVEMIDSAETVVVDGLPINAIRFPSEEIGTSYNVSFKVKEEPEILLNVTDGEFMSNTPFISPFCGTLSYIEIDESFRNRGLSTDSGTYYHICSLHPSLNRNFHVKFKGDYLGSTQAFDNASYLYTLIYGQIMLISDPNINVNITFSIPSGNTTYGTPDDVLVKDDINTYTFYAEYNQMQQNINEYPNLSISLETY